MSDSTDWLHILDRVLLRLTQQPQSQDPAGALVHMLVEEARVARAELWIYDQSTDTLTLGSDAERRADPEQGDAEAVSEDDQWLAREAVDRCRPLTGTGPHGGYDDGAARTFPPPDLNAYAAGPLMLGDQPRGAILLRQSAPFPRGTLAALPVLGRQTALLMEQAQVVAQARMAREAADRQIERLAALSRITHQLLAADELNAVVRVVAESASRLCDTTGAIVQLIDDERQHLIVLAAYGEPQAFLQEFQGSQISEVFYAETAAGQALAQRRTVVVEDYANWSTAYDLKPFALSLGVRALIAAPLLVDGAPIGVLWLCDMTERAFAVEDIALVEALADQAALAIQHTRLLARGEEAVVLEERARLARDLHDSVTQSVYSAHLMANAAYVQHERGAPALTRTLDRLRTISQDALSELRALLYELRPTALEEEGLAKALDKLVAAMQVRAEIPITYDTSSSVRLESEVEHAVFRIVQEAVTNATKYARATTISVTMAEQGGRLAVAVADDGVGFDPMQPPTPTGDGGRGGIGLRSMRERAVASGLLLRIESARGAGCRVIVEAPIR